mgnify:CR=1 FL=1
MNRHKSSVNSTCPIPSGLEEIHASIVSLINELINRSCNPSQIAVVSIEYIKEGVRITTIVSHHSGPRSRCSTLVFVADLANPKFFDKVESYIDGAISRVVNEI